MDNDQQNDMRHMYRLMDVVLGDVAQLCLKESTYRGSWKRAGGRSAWFMARRNMDRLISMMARPRPESLIDNLEDLIEEAVDTGLAPPVPRPLLEAMYQEVLSEDIFAAIAHSPSGDDGTVLACVRDLRTYLTLIEAEMLARDQARPRKHPSLVAWLASELSQPSAPLLRTEVEAAIQAYVLAELRLEGVDQLPEPTPAAPAAVPLEDSNKHAERDEMSRRAAYNSPPPLEVRGWYERRAPEHWQLREHLQVRVEALPPSIARFYVNLPPISAGAEARPDATGCVVNRALADHPMMLGYQFPSGEAPEMNHLEWTQLTGFWPALYHGLEKEGKWVIRPEWTAWSSRS